MKFYFRRTKKQVKRYGTSKYTVNSSDKFLSVTSHTSTVLQNQSYLISKTISFNYYLNYYTFMLLASKMIYNTLIWARRMTFSSIMKAFQQIVTKNQFIFAGTNGGSQSSGTGTLKSFAAQTFDKAIELKINVGFSIIYLEQPMPTGYIFLEKALKILPSLKREAFA